eukprot:gene13218-20426_t
MAAEGREREAVAAVLKGFSSADSASALEVLWDVLDALVWVSDEEYVHLFTAHVADLVKSHSDKVDHDKFYNMLGRWWRVFPPPVVKAACDAYTHNPPPLPPDYEQKLDSYNKGKEKVESKLKKRRRHQAENLLDAAEGEIRNGQITEAAELFRRYEPLADIPPSKTFLFQRGKTSLALKKHDEAMQDAVQLMERESKSDWVGWELCGAVYKDLEEFEAAAQSFATALQKQPPKPDFERVAKLLVEVRYELLIKDNCRKAIPALKQRAVEAFIEENYTLAAFCYTKLITLDPARGHLYHSNRSATYTKLRKYRLALQDADIVIDLSHAKKHETAREIHLDGEKTTVTGDAT